jgi:hypothetical protein
VHASELYTPSTGAWTEVASHTRDRVYHNSALLLPDMRVLLGGNAPIAAHYGGANQDQGGPFANNDNDPSFEVWSPPYLFRGVRPRITHAQAGLSYGEKFVIGTPDADSIESVLLMRTPSPEHVNDSDQRALRLEYHRTDANKLEATSPPSGMVAPPGSYYLVVNRKSLAGPIPSVARIVNVGTGTDKAEAIQPFKDDDPAPPTGGSATPDEDSSATGQGARRSSEALHSAPVPGQPSAAAPAAGPAGLASQVATEASRYLSASPAHRSRPVFPVLPAAAVGVAAAAIWTGRRWLQGAAP